MRLYTVFDKTALESGPLFEAKNDGVAWRMISNMREFNHKDYELWCLGHYSHDPVFIELFDGDLVVKSTVEYVEDEQ